MTEQQFSEALERYIDFDDGRVEYMEMFSLIGRADDEYHQLMHEYQDRPEIVNGALQIYKYLLDAELPISSEVYFLALIIESHDLKSIIKTMQEE